MSVHHLESRVADSDTYSFFGFPGAGKETNTKPLVEALTEAKVQTNVMEVGAIVRGHIRRNTAFGQYVKGLPKGSLVPDSEIIPVINDEIATLDPDALWFFDGFPRSIAQVPAYNQAIERHNRNDLMIHLRLSEDPQVEREISEERMRIRGEQMVLAAKTNPAIKPREDDVSPAARAKRLDEAQELYEVAELLRSQDKLIVVNAAQPKEAVQLEIKRLFRMKLARVIAGA